MSDGQAGTTSFTWLIEFAIQFVGVVLGVLLGFWLDRWWERRSKRANTLFILTAIRHELLDNVEIMNRISASLRVTVESNDFAIPYDHTNVSTWNAFYASNSMQSVTNTKLLTNLHLVYSYFDGFETLYGRYLSLAYFAIRRGLRMPEETIKEIALHQSELLGKIEQARDFTRKVISEMDSEIVRLRT